MTNGEYGALRHLFLGVYFFTILMIFIIILFFVKSQRRVKWITFGLKLAISISFIFNVVLKVIGVVFNGYSPSYAFSTLPIGNVSPLTFTLIFISMFTVKLKKITRFIDNWVSYLWIGMALATLLNPVGSMIASYNKGSSAVDPVYAFDCLGHAITSYLGLYLVKTKQTKPCWKNYGYACAFAGVVVTIIIVINVIFKTRYFGLSLTKPNIYGFVFTKNPYLNILLYVLGLGALLIVTQLGFWKYFKKQAEKAAKAKNE